MRYQVIVFFNRMLPNGLNVARYDDVREVVTSSARWMTIDEHALVVEDISHYQVVPYEGTLSVPSSGEVK